MARLTTIRTTRSLSLGVATVAALALAAPAQAATYRVDGKQKVIDADSGRYMMSGGLIGRWVTTSSQQVAAEPYYEATGTEEFRGCIDRRRDRSCAGDPSGTLSFDFRLWALNANPDPASLIWGACWHPLRGGTGDFRGAQGVLTFVDSPTAPRSRPPTSAPSRPRAARHHDTRPRAARHRDTRSRTGQAAEATRAGPRLPGRGPKP